MNIKTIHLPDDFIYEQLEQNLVENKQILEKILAQKVTASNYALTNLSGLGFESLGLLVLIGEAGSDEAKMWLGVAAYAESYSLELANYSEGSKEIEVFMPPRAESFFRHSVDPNSTAHTGRWLNAFYLMLMLYEPNMLDNILMNIRDEILKASSTKAPTYYYLQVAATKALYQNPANALEKIIATMEATQNLPENDREYAAYIAMHECGMMAKIALQDETGFNDEVELALNSHIKYYSDGETRRNAPEAWMCLPAFGLCALARKRGMKITVDSPYLPLALITK
ncbi:MULTISPECIES: immunity 49 family protein [unclassified Acinetobacter]|uniref:immunity 49 family protein n=1 Tax=unclassified Acinetobacter TaxID=196816 RepID=UPI0035B8D719